MSKKKLRHSPTDAPAFTQARDELFSHILRCGVMEALPEHQVQQAPTAVANSRIFSSETS